MLRRSTRAALPALIAALIGLTACGPAGGLAPTLVPTPTVTTPAPTTPRATEPGPSATPTTPSEPASVPTAAPSRTPPPIPPLPAPSLDATEVPAAGPAPAPGSRLDYLVTCEPSVPMWLDDGDGSRSWSSTERVVECEEGDAALLITRVRFEESRLLTHYEEDIGVPPVFRTPSGEAFGPDAIAAVRGAAGSDLVDARVPCGEMWMGRAVAGERSIACVHGYTSVQLDELQVAVALTTLELVPGFEGVIRLRVP